MINFQNHPLLTEAVIPDSVELPDNLTDLFFQCQNLQSISFNIPNTVSTIAGTYGSCYNLTGSPMCGDNVTNMRGTYHMCYNLTGSPVCGENVIDMSYAYHNCYNLTGSPVCGENVIDMSDTYSNCRNLTGSPVCGDKVTNMYCTYYNCSNLTGSPICGENVTDMYYTYYNCRNLIGSPVCGKMVTNMYQTYYNCPNLYGNAYFYSNNVSDMHNCFCGRNTSNRLNIYAHDGSITMNTLLINSAYSFVGAYMTWTNAGTYYYNTMSNIYIYPVANVAEIESAELFAKSLSDFEYVANEDRTYTLTGWKETLNGVSSTRLVIPDDNRIKL